MKSTYKYMYIYTLSPVVKPDHQGYQDPWLMECESTVVLPLFLIQIILLSTHLHLQTLSITHLNLTSRPPASPQGFQNWPWVWAGSGIVAGQTLGDWNPVQSLRPSRSQESPLCTSWSLSLNSMGFLPFFFFVSKNQEPWVMGFWPISPSHVKKILSQNVMGYRRVWVIGHIGFLRDKFG